MPTSTPSSHLFLIILLIASPLRSFGYTLGATELRDLEGTDPTTFASEIALGWTASSLAQTGVMSYTCAGNILLGGYDILPSNAWFTRNYVGLPAHTMFTFTANFWLMDSWNAPDSFLLDFDGTTFQGFLGSEHSGFPLQTNICGASTYSDLGKVVVTGKVLHTVTTLTVTLTNKMDEDPDNESFGMRDLILEFGTANATDIDSFCGSSVANYHFHTYDCTCPSNQYTSYNPGQCANCDPACKTCYWGSSADCYSCNNGYYQTGTSCLPCDPYCSKCSGPTADECSACNSPYYLVLGQSCINGCNPPMTASGSGSNLVCSYNCPSNKFVYPDGSCQTSCSQYMTSKKTNGVKFCNYYCTSPNYYDSVSGNCVASCPSGYYGDSTYRYCLACQTSLCAQCPTPSTCSACKTGAVLDENSKCKICDSMTVTYVKSTTTAEIYTVKFSPSTCILGSSLVAQDLQATDASKAEFPPFTFSTQQIDTYSYYLYIYFQQNVITAGDMDLELSYLTGVAPIPMKFIPSGTLATLQNAAPTVSTVIGGSLGASLGGAVALGATAALWSLVGFQQFVGYFIYINVDYPFQVQLFLSLLQSTSLSFLPNPLKSITNYLSDEYSSFQADTSSTIYQPPKKFVDQDMTSYFIDNGGSTIGIGLGILLLIAIIPPLLRIRVLPGRSLLVKVLVALKWNVTARSFLESGIPLSLAVFLQCRKISFSSLYTTFSVLMSFIGFCYIVAMFHFLFKYLQGTGNYFLELKKVKNSYGTLYEGMSLRNGLAKYYHLLILARGILLMFLITFLEAVPVMQVIPLIFFNMGLLYYLFKKAEFENPKLNTINRIKEFMILIGEVGVMCLTFKGGSEQYYNVTGWIIVGTLGCALLVDLGYTLGLQIMLLLEIPKKFKEWRSLMRKVVNKESAKKRREHSKI